MSDDCSADALRRRLRSRRRASSSDDDAESDEGDAERRRAAGLLDALAPLRGLAPPVAAEPEPFERAPATSLPFEPARPDDDDDAALFMARMSRSISSIVRVSRLTVLSFCGAPLPTEAMRRWRVELPLAAGAGAEEGPAERERDEGRDGVLGLASEEEEALVEEDEGREVDGLERAGEMRGESLAPGEGREEDARCCALARANEPLDGSSSRKRAACLRRARSSRVSPAGSSFSLPLADEPLLLLDEVALDEEACRGRESQLSARPGARASGEKGRTLVDALLPGNRWSSLPSGSSPRFLRSCLSAYRLAVLGICCARAFLRAASSCSLRSRSSRCRRRSSSARLASACLRASAASAAFLASARSFSTRACSACSRAVFSLARSMRSLNCGREGRESALVSLGGSFVTLAGLWRATHVHPGPLCAVSGGRRPREVATTTTRRWPWRVGRRARSESEE